MRKTLNHLTNEEEVYFPDVISESWEFQLTRDPFKINVDILHDHIQEQAKAEMIKFGYWRFFGRAIFLYTHKLLRSVTAKLLVQFSTKYTSVSLYFLRLILSENIELGWMSKATSDVLCCSYNQIFKNLVKEKPDTILLTIFCNNLIFGQYQEHHCRLVFLKSYLW